jgi:nucleoside-diphosphate-sugar epimerase
MLIRSLLHRIERGEEVVIEGNPGLRINPIYVEDAIRVFDPALHLRTSELFNVAGDEVVTITDLVRLIEKVSEREALLRHTDTSLAGDLVGDNARMREVLGVGPQISLLEGLRQTAQGHGLER